MKIGRTVLFPVKSEEHIGFYNKCKTVAHGFTLTGLPWNLLKKGNQLFSFSLYNNQIYIERLSKTEAKLMVIQNKINLLNKER